MQFISPLTLLIIPLIGCLLIMISPYKTEILLPSNVALTTGPEIINSKSVSISSGEKNFTVAWILGNKQNSNIKKIALITSLINFMVSILMWIQFDSSYLGYQFVTGVSSYASENISFLDLNLGVDAISICFVLLTTFITPIALLSSHKDIDKNLKLYLILILLLETLQIAVFVVIDLLLFYVFFESVLIPLFLIIGIWGASEAKVRAAYLLFLYTLFGSLFMLLAILQIYSHLGSTDFNLLSVTEISLEAQKLLWLGFFLAFAIKTPLWPFTGWLFRAHVEAPLSGSVILAAIILKLATYAYLRILLGFLPDATQFFNPLVQGICIVTLVYASLAALRTHDSKALVALSSISHCALIVLGLISNSVIGIEGGLLVSLAHGFVSPALFICVGGVIYVRVHSRVIPYIRGLATYMPIFSIYFLIFILANASVPLTAGWVGEQMSLIGIFEYSPIIGALGATSIFLTACYSVFLFNRIAFGKISNNLESPKDISLLENTLFFTLIIPTLLFGLFPDVLLNMLHPSVSDLIYNSSATNILELDTLASPLGINNVQLWQLETMIMPIIISKSYFNKNFVSLSIAPRGKLNKLSNKKYFNTFFTEASSLRAEAGGSAKNDKTFYIGLTILMLFIFIYLAFNYGYGNGISFLFSFIIAQYVLDKFKLSNNRIIKYLQVFTIYSLIILLLLAVYLCLILIWDIYFDNIIHCSNHGGTNLNEKIAENISNNEYYEFKFPKKPVDNLMEAGKDLVKGVANNIAPNIGLGTAIGTATAAMAKHTAGLPTTQRLILVGGTAIATSASFQASLQGFNALKDNAIQNSVHSDPNINRVPSPGPDSTFINSPLEEGENGSGLGISPLEIMILSILKLCISNFFLYFILVYFFVNRYLFTQYIGLITILLVKYNFSDEFIEKFKNRTNKWLNINNNFTLLMFIVVNILYILTGLIAIYFVYEVYMNLDSFVNAYNFLSISTAPPGK